ncbi:MAG: hypothetical protein IT392_04940 [Nitrospirae bacterium]|nr:hypothetical protein [Nitrospirota bacterium]
MGMIKRCMYAGFIVVILGMPCISGCAKKLPTEVISPGWITHGSVVFKDSEKKVLYGVGSVNGIKNKSIARTTAENMARVEIGKVFETYTASIIRNYMESTTVGTTGTESEAASGGLYIEHAVKTFSAVTLSGVMIIDHWKDPSNGTMYALARLDINNFKKSLDKAKELNRDLRDFVRKNADKAFDQLEAEEMKK